MSNNTETLTCASCGQPFDRERKRGVKPKNCPTCADQLYEAAREAAQAEAADKTQTFVCEQCGDTWTRPATPGKPPKRCEKCRGSKTVSRTKQANPQAAQRPAPVIPITPATHISAGGQYSLKRLLEDHTGVSMEDQYKFLYIESELGHKTNKRTNDEVAALKRVWATLEGNLA